MRNLIYSLILLAACSSNDVDSDEQARRAYLGLDTSIEKSLALGFDGFNSASSANISPQVTTGTKAGMLTITGQVDQGASANKGMRLRVGMVAYTDGPIEVNDNHDTIEVTYDTATDMTTQPALTLMLMGIPTGTLNGTLMGTYHLTGAIKGDVTLNLTFAGHLQDAGGGKVTRAPGTTMVTGTATQGDGVYNVALTL
jgi:hypothetical protein